MTTRGCWPYTEPHGSRSLPLKDPLFHSLDEQGLTCKLLDFMHEPRPRCRRPLLCKPDRWCSAGCVCEPQTCTCGPPSSAPDQHFQPRPADEQERGWTPDSVRALSLPPMPTPDRGWRSTSGNWAFMGENRGPKSSVTKDKKLGRVGGVLGAPRASTALCPVWVRGWTGSALWRAQPQMVPKWPTATAVPMSPSTATGEAPSHRHQETMAQLSTRSNMCVSFS